MLTNNVIDYGALLPSAKSTKAAKKKKDAESSDQVNEAESSKENNSNAVETKVETVIVPDEKTKKRQITKSSRANSAVSLAHVAEPKLEEKVQPANVELTEISSNNRKMTKSKSKLLAASVNGTIDSPNSENGNFSEMVT